MASESIDFDLGTRPSSAEVHARARVSRPAVHWARRYAQRLLITDVLGVVIAAAILPVLAGVGTPGFRIAGDPDLVIGHWWVACALIAGWLGLLAARDVWDPRVVGVGSEEYKRIAHASLLLFAATSAFGYFAGVRTGHGYLVVVFVTGYALLLTGRLGWRRWLVRQRRSGGFAMRSLVVGSRESVAELARQLAAQPQAGYRAVGACLPRGRGRPPKAVEDIPVVGDLRSVARAAHALKAEIVIVTSSDHLPARVVQSISWSLEPWEIDVAVVPAVADVAGPRLKTRPVGGLPLIHLAAPSYDAGQKVAKAAFDFVVGWVLVLLAAPVMLAVAVAVKLTSPGPVLYRQERIGYDGSTFDIFKFRSMRDGSDAELAELLAGQNRDGKPLFKVRSDPRVTRVGAFIRKYSLDELPQLFNVVRGEMSLVGPRPQRPAEVALYDSAAGRRLFVKPGITGLWQVSGRSNLSWEDAVRLDLYYVENWSVAGDLALLARTALVVLRKDGAF